MKILIIDGQGGRMGAQLVKNIEAEIPNIEIIAVGTNSSATAAMVKAGAQQAATGENPVVVACRTADVIIGPVGIVIADSLLGEITPKMASAVAQSRAMRILIPVNRCNNLIAGITNSNLSSLMEDVIVKIKNLI